MHPLVWYVSGHGFGHASRDIEVINAIRERRPDFPVIVRTSAKRWIFDLTLKTTVDFQPVEADTGIPSLVISGDLNDLRLISDEQTKTNIEAFIEQIAEGR